MGKQIGKIKDPIYLTFSSIIIQEVAFIAVHLVASIIWSARIALPVALSSKTRHRVEYTQANGSLTVSDCYMDLKLTAMVTVVVRAAVHHDIID